MGSGEFKLEMNGVTGHCLFCGETTGQKISFSKDAGELGRGNRFICETCLPKLDRFLSEVETDDSGPDRA